MITYTNNQVIENKAKLARRVSLGGLAIMLPGLVSAIAGLANPTFQAPEFLLLSYVSLITGTIVSTIGGRLAERWIIEPRDDQRLTKTLKGLDKRYRLVNYYTPADHVLLTPIGLYVIIMKDATGTISFEGQRWTQPFSLLRAWRDWRHGGLGDPTAEANTQIKKLQAWLKLPPQPLPRPTEDGQADAPIKPLVLFSKPEAELEIAEGYDYIMPLKNLKAYLLKHTTPALPSPVYRALAEAITPEAESEPEAEEPQAESEPTPTKASRKSRRKRRNRQDGRREKHAEET